jgi:hypothetical protein
MNNFLNKALESNTTVILPGFGALTITSQRTKDIYFIPYLKHDDGTLAKIISENTGDDFESSKVFLKNYVLEIIKAIESNSVFEIIEFGRFKKIHSGEIEFEKWEDYHKPEKPKKNNINNKHIIKEKNTIKNNQTENKELIEQVSLDTYKPILNKFSLDEILNEPKPSIRKIENEISDSNLEATIFESADKSDEVISEINEITELIINENSTIENSIIEIANETILIDESNNEIIQPLSESSNFTEEIDKTLKTKSKRKTKKTKTEEIQKIEETENNNSNKKKKNKLLPWLLIGLSITSGIIAYVLNSRKNEKIIISEKIIHKDGFIKKEIKTEVIKQEKKELKKSKRDKKIIDSEISKNKTAKREEKKYSNSQEKSVINQKIITKPTVSKTEIESNILSKKTNKNKRPSKQELKEADDIVSQLNTNKKNTEALNSIKTNISSKTKEINDKMKDTPSSDNKNMETNSSSRTNQALDKKTSNQVQPPTTSSNQNLLNSKQTTLQNSKTNTTQNLNPQVNSIKNIETSKNPISKNTTSTPINTNVNQKNITQQNNQKISTTAISNTKSNNQTLSNGVGTSKTSSNTNTVQKQPNFSKSTSQNTNTNQINQGSNSKISNSKIGKKIELIAESFKDKSSAEKLVSKLKEGGYKNSRIDEKDGQFNVVIDSYNTLSETVKELKKYIGQ